MEYLQCYAQFGRSDLVKGWVGIGTWWCRTKSVVLEDQDCLQWQTGRGICHPPPNISRHTTISPEADGSSLALFSPFRKYSDDKGRLLILKVIRIRFRCSVRKVHLCQPDPITQPVRFGVLPKYASYLFMEALTNVSCSIFCMP